MKYSDFGTPFFSNDLFFNYCFINEHEIKSHEAEKKFNRDYETVQGPHDLPVMDNSIP